MGMYDYNASRLPVSIGDESVSSRTPLLGRVRVRGDPVTVPPEAKPADIGFGAARLLGYTVSRTDDGLGVTLYWESQATGELDYTVFTHALGPNGVLLSQHDAQPANGSVPTSVWDQGEVVADHHQLPLPRDRQVTHLRVGLYDPATGKRLPTSEGADSVLLALP
jgi:hypothetical protein